MMQQNDLIKNLKALRHDPELGSRTRAQTEARRQILLEQIGATDLSRPQYSLRDHVEYWTSSLSVMVLKPAMVVVGLFVLAVGGWMTSVSAAYDSVPGDVLYPIKIASEQAQLTLATSAQQRAQLHMEFASRRLQEVNTITSSADNNKSGKINAAVAAFKTEVNQAKDDMQKLPAGDAVQVASTLDAKADEYSAAIDQAVTQINNSQPADVGQAVAAVQDDVKQAADAAVGVLVSTAEQEPDSIVTASLKQSFQNSLSDIDTRVKLNLGRIDVIRRAALSTTATVTLTANQLTELTQAANSLKHFDGMLTTTMNVFANGGYRDAFNTVSNIEGTIDAVEAQLATIELDVVSQQAADADEDKAAAPSSDTTSTDTTTTPSTSSGSNDSGSSTTTPSTTPSTDGTADTSTTVDAQTSSAQ